MSSKPDIVIFGLPRWDGPFSSTALSLAAELAKEARVFYIENPYTLKDLITLFWKRELRNRIGALLLGIRKYERLGGNSNLINITPLVTLPINFLPAGRIYDFLFGINNFLVDRVVVSIKRDFKMTNYLFINSYNPFYFKKIKIHNPIATIYHCVDNISESKYIAKHGVRLEREMIKEYDLAISTSRKLLEYTTGINANSFLLPNAADFSLFGNSPTEGHDNMASEIKSRNKVIGYIGSVDHRIDYELLRKVVLKYPQSTLLLVGPVSKEYKDSQIGKYRNVISVGSKPLSDLPMFVRSMDCAIIPFKLNRLTECIYPLKLNEYLGAGIPVVTTNFSKDLIDFSDLIGIANSSNEFVKLIGDEIESDSENKKKLRISRAAANSWENRAFEFWEIIKVYNSSDGKKYE